MSVNEAMGLLLKEGAFDSSPDLYAHIGKWGAPIGPDGKRQVRAVTSQPMIASGSLCPSTQRMPEAAMETRPLPAMCL